MMTIKPKICFNPNNHRMWVTVKGPWKKRGPYKGRKQIAVLHRDKGESRIGELSGEEYEREW